MNHPTLALAMLVLFACAVWPPSNAAATPDTQATVDCSAAYGGASARCVPQACSALYRSFMGTWTGSFETYSRKLSTAGHDVYRPFHNAVHYAPGDCLSNPASGESFIVGHETDRYPAFRGLPAKVTHSLLITGRHRDGTPFLRTVNGTRVLNYALAYHNAAAKLAIWQLARYSAGGQGMAVTVIDAKDFTRHGPPTREVTITLDLGPKDHPYWSGVLAYGSHTRNASPTG